jgi:hypothetical protein
LGHLHSLVVAAVSFFIIFINKFSMRKLLQHLLVHLLVGIGLAYAGQLLLQFVGGTAFSGGVCSNDQTCDALK